MAEAIGRVTVGGRVRGSGFAISPEHLLTAFHCVRGGDGNPDGDTLGFSPVGIEPLPVRRVVSWDRDRDFALLELAKPLPQGWDPIPVVAIGEQVREATFQSKGFPQDRPQRRDLLAMHGSIVDPAATLGGVPALQMFSNEIAAGRDPRGFSGAPVRVKTSWRADGDLHSGWAAVGLVRWAQPEPGSRRVGYGGVVYASPLAEIAAADPTVADQLVSAAPPGGFPWPRDYPRRFEEELAAAAGFVGREAILESIQSFPEDHDCGYVHVEASAGLGKSALAARFASLVSAPVFFADAGSNNVRADQCALHLGAEVVLRHDLDADRFDDWTADTDVLATVLPAAGAAARGPVWLVVDGLDEAEAAPAGANPLMLPPRLPAGVFILLTSREPATAFHAGKGTPLRALSLTAEGEEERDDLNRFIVERAEADPRAAAALGAGSLTAEEFAARLAAAAEGNFMYATYVLEDLADGTLDPENPPERLLGYYERNFWSAMEVHRERDPVLWSGLYLPVLERLAVAAEPVDAGWLAGQVGGSATEIENMVLRPWRRFLRATSTNGATAWRIVHHSFTDFLGTKFGLAEAHHNVARAGRPSLDPYAHRHLAEHLRQAGELDELAALLADPDWEREQLAVDPAGELLVHDIEQLRLAADAVDEAALASGSPPARLGMGAWATLAAASVRSGMQKLPPALLAALVAEGLWPRERALRTARQAPDPGPRARSLAALAGDDPLLQEEALAAATEVEDLIRRIEATIEVAETMPPQRREQILLELLGQARAARGSFYEAPQAAMHLVAGLPSEALPTVFGIAHDAQSTYDRCDLFLVLAERDPEAVAADPAARAAMQSERLPESLLDVLAFPAESPQAVEAATALIDELDATGLRTWGGSQRHTAWLVWNLAPRLDAAGLRRALSACKETGGFASDATARLVEGFLRVDEPELALEALSLGDTLHGARVLAEKGKGLPANLVARAVEIVAEHPIAYTRTEAIATLVPLLPPGQRRATIEAALPQGEFDDLELRAQALCDYSRYLDPDQALTVLRMLGQGYSSSDKAYGLAALAPALPEEALEVAFNGAETLAHKADDEARAAMVRRLTGPSLVAAARSILQSSEVGDPAAIAVARTLDRAGFEEILTELSAWIMPIAPNALFAIAPHLADEQVEMALSLLDEEGARQFLLLRSVGRPWGPEDSAPAFAARLREFKRSPELLVNAVGVLVDRGRAGDAIEVIESLRSKDAAFGLVQLLGDAGLIDEALRLALELPAMSRSRMLSPLAPELDPDAALTVYDRVLVEIEMEAASLSADDRTLGMLQQKAALLPLLARASEAGRAGPLTEFAQELGELTVKELYQVLTVIPGGPEPFPADVREVLYPALSRILTDLAGKSRRDVLLALGGLAPAYTGLGGSAAAVEVAGAMLAIGERWP